MKVAPGTIFLLQKNMLLYSTSGKITTHVCILINLYITASTTKGVHLKIKIRHVLQAQARFQVPKSYPEATVSAVASLPGFHLLLLLVAFDASFLSA